MSPNQIKAPCLDCTKRRIGCHDRCSKFLKFKQRLQARAMAIRKEQESHRRRETTIANEKTGTCRFKRRRFIAPAK